jgi:ornithine cyclodeaminase/alanine dehydrogenase-like protein (mu-crystallin family)
VDNSVLIIGRRELASLMDLDAYLASADAAFRAHAEGRATVPMPLHIAVEGGGFHAKGAALVIPDAAAAATIRDPHSYAAVKVNSNFPGNPALGMPTIQGAVLLFHAGDGRLLAILDSIEITSRRTAAASALAARHLSREDSSTITILGCGEQGRAQLTAIARVRPIERAFAWDADPARAVTFAAEMSHHLRLEVKPAAHLRDAAIQSDIVVTVHQLEVGVPFARRHRPGDFHRGDRRRQSPEERDPSGSSLVVEGRHRPHIAGPGDG